MSSIITNISKYKIPLYVLGAFVACGIFPYIAGAQGITFQPGGEFDAFGAAITTFINNILVPLVFAIAFLVFIWGVFSYFILAGDSEDARESARKLMLYAIIGFVLMVSIWGITNLIAGGLGFDQETPIEPPTSPTS